MKNLLSRLWICVNEKILGYKIAYATVNAYVEYYDTMVRY